MRRVRRRLVPRKQVPRRKFRGVKLSKQDPDNSQGKWSKLVPKELSVTKLLKAKYWGTQRATPLESSILLPNTLKNHITLTNRITSKDPW